ncbi:MAG: phosphoribosylglycinamide formyltransferase [candidate division KSB1 bacterium]|nr:phosphoribosylglycinamide formyltransferase [candidate division KSB1 bacterium]
MSSRHPLRITALGSGRGSNIDSVYDAIQSGQLDAEIVGVISNNSTCGVMSKARDRGIQALHVSGKTCPNAREFEQRMLQILTDLNTELVVLAGYMKKVPTAVIQKYQNRILNIHPALLPAFGGKGLYGRHVHQAVLDYGAKVSGATVHLVDVEYDTGPPVVQECVPVYSDDTPDSLAARVLEVEHRILPRAVRLFAEKRIEIDGRRVVIRDQVRLVR